MMPNQDVLLDDLARKTGKDKEELTGLLNDLKQKYAGLLTDSGALLLLSRELGAGLDDAGEELSLQDLKAGLKNINVSASLELIYNEREVDSSKGPLFLRNIVLVDEGRKVKLSLFGKQAFIPDRMQLEKGDKIKLTNCITQDYNNELQLRLGWNGKIELIEKNSELMKLSDIKPEQSASISGIITKKFNEKTFKKEGKTTKLLAFELTDEAKSVKCNAWNNSVQRINYLNIGAIIKVENAFARKGLNDSLEVNLNDSSRIIPDYWQNSLIDLKKTLFREKSFSDLDSSGSIGKSIVKGVVVMVNDSSFVYDACSVCSKKTDNGFCPTCNATVKTIPKLFLSLLVDDGNSTFTAVSFNALHLLPDDDSIEKLKEKIVGKKFELIGAARLNSMNNEKEFLADGIKEIE